MKLIKGENMKRARNLLPHNNQPRTGVINIDVVNGKVVYKIRNQPSNGHIRARLDAGVGDTIVFSATREFSIYRGEYMGPAEGENRPYGWIDDPRNNSLFPNAVYHSGPAGGDVPIALNPVEGVQKYTVVIPDANGVIIDDPLIIIE